MISIHSCDPTDRVGCQDIADKVGQFIDKYPNAEVMWLQSSAACGGQYPAHPHSHRLTAIITVRP